MIWIESKTILIQKLTKSNFVYSHSRSSKIRQSNYSSNNGNHQQSTSTTSSDAQAKFGNAKAISSDQYFGNDKSDVSRHFIIFSNILFCLTQFESRSTNRRFEGSTSISSDDFFGRQTSHTNPTISSNFNSSNLYDFKEDVKDNVSRFAGRLSNLASDVVRNINKLDFGP